MTTAWLDTNVVLRFLTKDPRGLWQRADRLMARAQAGEIALRLSPIIVAEIVWALGSQYGHRPEQIAKALSAFLRADGIVADAREGLLEAWDLTVGGRGSCAGAYRGACGRGRVAAWGRRPRGGCDRSAARGHGGERPSSRSRSSFPWCCSSSRRSSSSSSARPRPPSSSASPLSPLSRRTCSPQAATTPPQALM